MTVTARDIAQELNLSQPTVSRILNGDRRHRIAEITRTRVLDAARRLGYQPNAVAQSLRRGRTHIVGLYTNHNYDARNDFLGTIIGSLQRACELQGLDLLLHSALLGRSTEELYGKLRDGRIDGLILHASPDDPLVEMLGACSLPVVAIADRLRTLQAVTCDDADGIRQMITHLWRKGHRRFAFLAPEMTLASVDRRRDAFESELEQRGVAEQDRRVLSIDFEKADAVLEALLMNALPTAVCCWNDRAAYNLLRACLAHGVRVPEQLAITGFDGFTDDKIPSRHLVTICCPWEKVASTALDLLTRQISSRSGDAEEAEGSEICLPVTLVTGDTA